MDYEEAIQNGEEVWLFEKKVIYANNVILLANNE